MKAMESPVDPKDIPLPLRRMTRAEYDQLIVDGFFRKNERIELIHGVLVAMPPIDWSHVNSVQLLHEMLLLRLGDRARVFCQAPFAASDDSEPEPDVLVVPRVRYKDHPSKALLVAEVARSSLRYDRSTKKDLYGLSDVREYWIVNHVDGVVEVYRDRHNGRWRSVRTYARGEMIAPLEFPDVEIPVAEILPPAEMDGEQKG